MLISLSQAIEPTGGYTTRVCDAWPVQRLPSHRALPPIGRYQFILFGEQRHVCVNNLPRVVREAERPGLPIYLPSLYLLFNLSSLLLHVRLEYIAIFTMILRLQCDYSDYIKILDPKSRETFYAVQLIKHVSTPLGGQSVVSRLVSWSLERAGPKKHRHDAVEQAKHSPHSC